MFLRYAEVHSNHGQWHQSDDKGPHIHARDRLHAKALTVNVR